MFQTLPKGESFYVEALGCKKIRYRGDKMTVLATDNAEIYLQEREAGSTAVNESNITRDYERHWTPVVRKYCDGFDLNMILAHDQYIS